MSRSQAQPDTSTPDPLVASSCLDFLLIELVPLAQRITERLDARHKALLAAGSKSHILNKSLALHTTASGAGTQERNDNTADGTSLARDSTTTAGIGPGSAVGLGDDLSSIPGLMTDDVRQGTWFRLEQIGYRVGQGLVERFTANKPRPTTPLDTIKLLCKDLWPLLYRKPIDNLKTNHRGIFVLTDSRFHPLSRISVDLKAGPKAREETLQRAQSFLVFPAGVIKGVLMGLGVECVVVAETVEVPGARFEVRVKGAKP